MSWKKLCLKHRLDLSQFLDLWSFSKKVLISRDKLFVSKSLPEWFKCRPSFQRHSFFDIRVINKMEIVHETFSFQSFIYYTNKSQVAQSVYRHALNKYNFYTKSNTFFSNIDDTVGYNTLLTSEFMISLVLINKTAISVITPLSFKVGWI